MKKIRQNQKNITKPIKKKTTKKVGESIIEIFLKMKKSKKEIMVTSEIKLCQT